MDEDIDYYDILEVTPGASLEEIKAAWRDRIKEYHVDTVEGRGREIKELAARKSKEINRAKDILTDPGARKRYDAGRSASESRARGARAKSESGARSSADPREDRWAGAAGHDGESKSDPADGSQQPADTKAAPRGKLRYLLIVGSILVAAFLVVRGYSSFPRLSVGNESGSPSPSSEASSLTIDRVAASPLISSVAPPPSPVVLAPSLPVGPLTRTKWRQLTTDSTAQVTYYVDESSVRTLSSSQLTFIVKAVYVTPKLVTNSIKYKSIYSSAIVDCLGPTYALGAVDIYDESNTLLYAQRNPPDQVALKPVKPGTVSDIDARYACGRSNLSTSSNPPADLNGLY